MKSNDSFVHNLRSDFHMTQRTLAPVRFSDGLTGLKIRPSNSWASLKRREKAGVSCDTDYVTSSHPYEMIIKAAEKKGCDLIMMASHGRRGLQGLLIGSETHKVLTHTKIPVLVFR